MKEEYKYWDEFFKKEEPDDSQWEEAIKKSEDWPTCACGAMDDHIGRMVSGAPVDDALESLGYKFMFEISGRRKKEAMNTFSLIQFRSHQILEEQQKP